MQANFFGDDPLQAGSTLDSLERAQYADQLVEVLQQVRQQTESSVLAVIGPWGSGKSSILNMVIGKVDKGPWAVAHFNPWIYSDQESLQHGFFTELRASMEDEAWKEPKRAIGALGKAVAPFGKLSMLAGVPDASGMVSKLGELIAGDASVTKTKALAEAALRDAGRPVLVVMDDLDRLTPDELLLTLKLVRLVGRLPNVYYLLRRLSRAGAGRRGRATT
jgi:predicted KAP-like P-loop ATPase